MFFSLLSNLTLARRVEQKDVKVALSPMRVPIVIVRVIEGVFWSSIVISWVRSFSKIVIWHSWVRLWR